MADLTSVLNSISSAKNLNELKALVQSTSAAADRPDIMLYRGFGTDAATVQGLANAKNAAIIDNTLRGQILADRNFIGKFGQLSGITSDIETVALWVNNPTLAPESFRAQAQAANEFLFGRSEIYG